MKAFLFVVALALIPACGKKNDAHILQHEAVTLAKYYQPKLQVLDQRVQAIFKRGTSIPGNIPGIEDVGRRLQEARDTIIKLNAIVAPGQDQKSAVEKQAEAAVKENKVDELRKLVHESEVALVTGVTAVNANLDTVEAWIAQYDAKTLALAAPTKPAEEPATPEAQSTPATGQPPAAVPGTGAAPAPAAAPEPTKTPAAAPPKADAKAPAQPKPPTAQPKAPAAQPKAPAAQPAQPKAAAPAQNK